MRQHSGNTNDLRPLKRRSDKSLGASKKPKQSDTKRDGEAFRENRSRSSSEDYEESSPNYASDCLTPSDVDQGFFRLWIEQPSWSPIMLDEHGWKTAINHTGKKVPLTLRTIESYYRRHIVLGKRFGKFTNYLLIDIDTGSPYHPNNGSIKPILAAMECLGLCRYILIRSSTSEGLHIYFPLNESVNAWGLACLADAALAAHGITVASGQCELFPNKKSLNAEHNGHRLPLQDGSFLVDDDFCPFSNHLADFLQHWQLASDYQDNETLLRALVTKTVPTPEADTIGIPVVTAPQVRHQPTNRTNPALPPIRWTRRYQSNRILRELVNYGDRYLGLKTIDDLAAWVKAVAPQLDGYNEFASPKSKKDIELGTWPRRWAKSHFKSAWKFKTGGSNHNAEVAAEAKRRIFDSLARLCVDVDIAFSTLHRYAKEISKIWYGLTIGWSTFKKHEAEIREYVKRTGKVGLSRGFVEDVNSFSSEPVLSENAGPELRTEKLAYKLLTLRCVVSAYSKVFSNAHTSKSEAVQGGYEHGKTTAKQPSKSAVSDATLIAAENSPVEVTGADEKEQKSTTEQPKGLTVGQQVRITMPGGSLDGIETKVIARALNVLGQPVYQLDYQRQGQTISLPPECLQAIQTKNTAVPKETEIAATTAQLAQVLGKTCPFVGPGLWTVKRSEVTSKAWKLLCELSGRSGNETGSPATG